MEHGLVKERSLVRVVGVIGATALMLLANGFASWLSPLGKNTGQISEQFQNFFTPAGYVFSIWGLIYLGLLAFAVYQALPSQRNHAQIANIDILYTVSCLLNAAWMFVWQREWFVATMVVMIGLLGTLIAIYVRLDQSRYRVGTTEGWFVHWPFSVYLGWITVATVANATILLQYLGWKGGGIAEPVWGAMMVAVACAIVLGVAIPRKDRAYLLVLTWATIGIAIKYQSTSVVLWTAGGVALLCAGVVGYFWLVPFHQPDGGRVSVS